MNTLEEALEMSEAKHIPYLKEYEEWLQVQKNGHQKDVEQELKLLEEIYQNEIQCNSQFQIEIIAAIFSKSIDGFQLIKKKVEQNASKNKSALANYFQFIEEYIIKK